MGSYLPTGASQTVCLFICRGFRVLHLAITEVASHKIIYTNIALQNFTAFLLWFGKGFLDIMFNVGPYCILICIFVCKIQNFKYQLCVDKSIHFRNTQTPMKCNARLCYRTFMESFLYDCQLFVGWHDQTYKVILTWTWTWTWKFFI